MTNVEILFEERDELLEDMERSVEERKEFLEHAQSWQWDIESPDEVQQKLQEYDNHIEAIMERVAELDHSISALLQMPLSK